ncbi:AsnC family transcriptional regulator [Candidatus Woesearchaeota archaeon]|nr:AsnC family transcriptional regulator [Candidatus Woesearchaeota archaeon]
MASLNRPIGEFYPRDIVRLDVKDKKLISLLLANGSLSYSQFGKQIGLSRSNVARRVTLLEEKGVIVGYNAFIDVSKLGINTAFLLLHTQNLREEKHQLLERISRHPAVFSILELTGKYDTLVAFYYREDEEQDRICEDILTLVIPRDFYISTVNILFPPIDYIGELFPKTAYSRINQEDGEYNADEHDVKILRILSENFRTNKVEIAKKLGISREMIYYRTKRLFSSGIIAKFQTTIDPFSLGLEPYFVRLKLSRPTQRANLIKFFSDTKRCNTILSSAQEIMTFIHLKSHKEFITFENKLVSLFREQILEYSFEYVLFQHKLEWFTQSVCLKEKNRHP